MGVFLFRPMALAVAFAHDQRLFVVANTRALVQRIDAKATLHQDEAVTKKGWFNRLFRRWEALIDKTILQYVRGLDFVLRHRIQTVIVAVLLLVTVLLCYGSILRKEFFPEVGSGAFEMVMRGPSGLRIEKTEEFVAEAEKLLRETIGEHDLQMIIAEIGVVPDWSAAYTPNSGPMDTVLKVQLKPHREHTAEYHIANIRSAVAKEERFSQFEFGFDSGGMIRSALNEGKSIRSGFA